ncbi:acetate--CoA ligase family protein, partial [Methanocalculus sp.]|uniref:acetate--CoA ligase family protein n=1 Tax=Methanocalculus sp. TaxID=2004547 RepID=UPI002618F557
MTVRHISGQDAYSILSKYGIPVPRDGLARDEDEASSIAQRIGYPVVLKIESPDILHKSDVGGVILGIKDERELREGYARLIERAGNLRPDAGIIGVRIEEEAAPGLEILIGGANDPAFGKTITFGLGGKLVELLRDTSIRILPLDKEEIRSMIREIKGYQLIRGFRDEPPRDEEALVNAIAAAADLFLDHPGFTEFDINPLILHEDGCI